MAITKINTPELLDINTTGAKQLPSGPTTGTGGRPTTGLTAGDFRYNTTDNRVEYYDGAAWFQIDDEAIPAPTPVGSEHFNVNTYFGNGATQTIDAKFNEAANFNGSSSTIDLPNLGISGAAERTISAWINTNSLSATQTIFQYGTNAAKSRFGFSIDTAGKLYIEYFGRDIITTSNQITTGNWFHVAVTYNGGDIQTATNTQIYVNGSAVGISSSGTSQGPATTSNANYGIGYDRANTRQFFNGKIDQVRIYNTALGLTQVEDLYTDETTTTASSLSFPSGETATATYQLDGNGDDVSGTYSATSTTDVGYTGLKFKPDLVWAKSKTSANYHYITDSVRGVKTVIYSNATNASGPDTSGLSSFNSNGFSVGPSGGWNGAHNYVAWNWKAGGAPTATNSAGASNVPTAGSVKIDGADSTTALAGTIAAKSISANTAAGFSIVKWTGGSATGLSVAHELGVAPSFIILKIANTTSEWYIYHKDLPSNQSLRFTDDAANTALSFPNVNTLDFNSNWTATSYDFLAYCFASVLGYSKIDSYQGGQTLNTANQVDFGFAPAFVLIKNTTDSGSQWMIFDDKRTNGYALFPNRDVIEEDYTSALLLSSQGLEFKSVNINVNKSGSTYIYLAIAS